MPHISMAVALLGMLGAGFLLGLMASSKPKRKWCVMDGEDTTGTNQVIVEARTADEAVAQVAREFGWIVEEAQ